MHGQLSVPCVCAQKTLNILTHHLRTPNISLSVFLCCTAAPISRYHSIDVGSAAVCASTAFQGTWFAKQACMFVRIEAVLPCEGDSTSKQAESASDRSSGVSCISPCACIHTTTQTCIVQTCFAFREQLELPKHHTQYEGKSAQIASLSGSYLPALEVHTDVTRGAAPCAS